MIFGFDDLEDLIEADFKYGLFKDDDEQVQQVKKQSKNQKQKIKSFGIYLKHRILEKNIE